MTRITATHLAIVVAVLGVATVTGSIGYLAVTVDDAAPADSTDPPETTHEVDEAIIAAHDHGVTGENVSVGVLDVTGFAADRPPLAGRTAETRTFGADTAPADSGDTHGTAAAATVARVAPDADLYLGTFSTPESYSAGLGWMLDNDVDVVVTPVAATDTMGDGTGELARTTANAVDQGLVVVAPTGNVAQGHWRGEYDSGPTGHHEFSGEPLNDLRPINNDEASSRAEFTISWEEPSEAYTLELHRRTDDGTELLAQSVRESDTHGRLGTQLDPAARYAVAVDGPENDTHNEIRITSTTHALAVNDSAGSIAAPATAPGVIAVGATAPGTAEIEPFSGRGPTPDDRPGVDVVAPHNQPVPTGDGTFTGTSAAAAFVGGVAALVLDVEPTLAPLAVRWQLLSTAGEDSSSDEVIGHGLVDPWAAIEDAADEDLDPGDAGREDE